MNIYFSCSITGGRGDQSIYKVIVDHLLQLGHEIPTAHLSHENVTLLEAVVDPKDVYQRDVAWVKGCDALIAEVSTPSHGVGYEIALALELKKPVLCLFRQGARVSKMITGNTMPTIQVQPYTKPDDAVVLVDAFINAFA